MRYIIASNIPTKTSQAIINAYPNCSIQTLHLTFLSPFVTSVPEKIHTYLQNDSLPFIDCHLTKYGVFSHQQQSILYITVEPQNELKKIYQSIHDQVRDQIVVENSIDFLAHISLDYNFQSTLPSTQPSLSQFTLPKPTLWTEKHPGCWMHYST